MHGFFYFLRFCEDITERNDSNDNFKQIAIIWCVSGKKIKIGVHKHNFSPAMHSWEVFPSNKRYSTQKKKFVKLIYSIKTNLITSFFSKFLVMFFRNSIKYVVSRVVLGALSGALKVALLIVMIIQSAF